MKLAARLLAVTLILCPALAAGEGSGKATAAGKGIPPKAEVLSLVRKVNSYQLANPYVDAWEAANPVDAQIKRPWTRATWYTGVMAMWKATKDPAFLDQAIRYGHDLAWGVGEEQLGGNRLFPIEIWTEIYFAKNDRSMIDPAIRWLDTPDPLTPAGQKRWYLDSRDPAEGPPVPYIDSTYGAPALAMLAKATGDKKYLDILTAFLDDVMGVLQDPETGLFYRDPRFIGRQTKNGKKILWSRGNGWVYAALPRVLDYLPKDHPSREHYLAVYRRMSAELVRRQGSDGLWRANLDDPDEFPDPETSGSGFFCFGLAWGVNHRVLSRREYLPAVAKAWHGLSQSVSPEGKVLWGQLVDDRPHTAARESSHEYVTGTFLLAGSEMYKLARGR